MRWWRRIVLGLGLTLAGLVVVVLLWGWTTTIKSPYGVADPVTVYVVDHGHTPSLLVPTPEGGAVRYAYGDWVYYAQGNRHLLWNAVPALLWPTPACVGRQPLDTMPDGEPTAMAQAIGVVVDELHAVVVERERVEALHARLESQFRERWAERLSNPQAKMTFVPHEDRYTWFHDSNHVVARWLEELGAERHGPPWAIHWRVESADD